MYDIYFDPDDMHQNVEETSDEEGYFYIGENFNFDFLNDTPPTEQDDYAVIVKKYGCKCDKCDDFFPDAEVVSNFRCWSCKNF